MKDERFADAQTAIEEGLREFPDDFWLARSLTIVLRKIGSVDTSFQLVHEIALKFSGHPQAHADLANCLLNDLHEPEAAEEAADAALRRFPSHLWLGHAFAVCAEKRSDHSAALDRWTRLNGLHPQHTLSIVGMVEALWWLGRLDDAEEILEKALASFPHDQHLAMSRAWIALARADWADAIRRWTKLRKIYPTNESVKRGYSEAAWNAASEGNWPNQDDGRSEEESAELLMKFESLGSDCEFGLVQRHFGAEPLSLMRWFGIPPAGTLKLLKDQLAGLGDPREATLITDHYGYLRILIRRYSITANTLTLAGGVDEAEFFAAQCRKLNFLREKMLRDLTSGEKIWVYKRNATIEPDLPAELLEALARYGPNRLLVVHRASDPSQDGIVRAVSEILHIATLGRVGPDRICGGWNTPFDAWLRILRCVVQRV